MSQCTYNQSPLNSGQNTISKYQFNNCGNNSVPYDTIITVVEQGQIGVVLDQTPLNYVYYWNGSQWSSQQQPWQRPNLNSGSNNTNNSSWAYGVQNGGLTGQLSDPNNFTVYIPTPYGSYQYNFNKANNNNNWQWYVNATFVPTNGGNNANNGNGNNVSTQQDSGYNPWAVWWVWILIIIAIALLIWLLFVIFKPKV
jgi:hypothetical protein